MIGAEQILKAFIGLVQLFLLFLVLRAIFRALRKKSEPIHWHSGIQNFHYSSEEFYKLVADNLDAMEIPGIKDYTIDSSIQDISLNRREYLIVQRRGIRFDICAAPFGTTYFFSYWQTERLSVIRTFLDSFKNMGWLAQLRTFYAIDTRLMFQGAVHSAIMDAIDQVTKEKGHRGLSEHEKRPKMQDLFKR